MGQDEPAQQWHGLRAAKASGTSKNLHMHASRAFSDLLPLYSYCLKPTYATHSGVKTAAS